MYDLVSPGEFCFAPIRGEHWTASARGYHWKAVRAAAGWKGSRYLATRHFAGWHMVLNAVRKLAGLGEQLGPPHVKSLKGDRAAKLHELRPRQGQSDWRAIYRRAGDFYVILAIDRHKDFDALIERAQTRAERYAPLKPDKP